MANGSALDIVKDYAMMIIFPPVVEAHVVATAFGSKISVIYWHVRTSHIRGSVERSRKLAAFQRHMKFLSISDGHWSSVITGRCITFSSTLLSSREDNHSYFNQYIPL